MNFIKLLFARLKARYDARSNPVARMSADLILVASIISLLAGLSYFPEWVKISLPILAATLSVAGSYLQNNPVWSRSSWFLLAYAVIDVWLKYSVAWPQAQELLLTLAGSLRLLAGFTTRTDPPVVQSTES